MYIRQKGKSCVPEQRFIIRFLEDCLGLTLSFQARGPKRSLDKNKWSKFLVMIHTILGPYPEKSRGPQQNLRAYAPGKVEFLHLTLGDIYSIKLMNIQLPCSFKTTNI